MGGNKHKNGIVCMFPGCEKTMRTQKFKLHFTKQHLKPGEVYTVEHRRRFEVARDEEYTSDATAPTHKLEQQPQLAIMSVQIPTTYQQVAAAVAASTAAGATGGSTGMTPTLTPIAASSVVTAVESVAENAGAAANAQLDVAQSQALLIEEAVNQQAQLLEEQQRLNRLAQQQQQQSHPADARVGDTPPTATTTAANSLTSPPSNKRPASALEPSSADAPSAATTSTSQGQDPSPSRAVLVQYIEMMDQRFHELIQKMSQVIDGQRELIDMLRRPFPADTAQLLDQTPSLSGSPNDDGSAKKRRKFNSGAEQTQQQTNGAAQRPSTASNTDTPPTSALL
ncbi:hypothetical protein Gpo141_00000448 [Globisporangium polare]